MFVHVTPEPRTNCSACPELMRFKDEISAHNHVVQTIRPFCHKLVEQPAFRLSNGAIIRPDIGLRLTALPDIPLIIECKPFAAAFAQLSDAIAQAADYSAKTNIVAFVAPLRARQPTQLTWYAAGAVGGALMVGAHFNVGALAFVAENDRFRGELVGILYFPEQAIARFAWGEHGEPITTLHRDAERLLRCKYRNGSSTWRGQKTG